MAYTFKHGDRPLDGFTIQRGIGRGGFGEVYYAISDGGREVALKYLRDNSEIELRGVSQCMNLKSPHLVSIFDVKKNDQGDYFIIMEHIAGPSLSELLIAEPNGLGVEKAAFLLREIGKGLADLHDRGIVHRDMKPANIFYEDGHIKIGDYGLSKFISVSRHSAQSTSVGTVHYMAPEVGSGNYHRGIDIYALGVILYEMLLGRVPFEGSSMGEVLMKHLTEQPEVSDLPEPFGKVIRKALEKDPKDRYQTVNEMIDDMLEVGDIRNSLASFNPNTITSIPRRPIPEPMRTPAPSPNPVVPPPPPAAPVGAPALGQLPGRLEQRIHRVHEKVSRKMDRLAGRPHRRDKPPYGAGRSSRLPAMSNDMTGAQRLVVATLITFAIAIGAGFVAGMISEREVVGVATGLMIPAILLATIVSTKVLSWLGGSAQPRWVQGLIFLGAAAPPMTIACTPLIEMVDSGAFALLAGMLVTLFFCNTEDRIEAGTRGELSFVSAFTMGLCGMICCVIAAGILDVGDEEAFLLMGAVISGAVSLALQALGWLLPRHWMLATAQPATDQQSPPDQPSSPAGQAGDPPPPIQQDAFDSEYADAPFAIPVPPGTPASGYVSSVPLPPFRSGFARGFWSIVAFAMLSGMIFCILFASLVNHSNDDLQGLVVGAVACGSLMLFAAQKLSLQKRQGFWKETLCPFLIAIAMIALSACISAVAIKRLNDDEFAGAVGGIMIIVGLLLVLLASRVGLLAWLFGGSRSSGRKRPFMIGAAIRGTSDTGEADGFPADPDIPGN